jgi:asparagine synthetase A
MQRREIPNSDWSTDPATGAVNLEPAKYQWRRAAALALDISRSDNLYLHRESVRITQDTLARIHELVENAAKQTEVS